jgi:hypothetical protein
MKLDSQKCCQRRGEMERRRTYPPNREGYSHCNCGRGELRAERGRKHRQIVKMKMKERERGKERENQRERGKLSVDWQEEVKLWGRTSFCCCGSFSFLCQSTN